MSSSGTKPASTHNLDVKSYSLDELFRLLKISDNPTKEEMLIAKRRVLQFHPDKSGLSPDYFIFYKKAFEIATHYYEEHNKISRPITEDTTEYKQFDSAPNAKVIREKIQKMTENKQFDQGQFNQYFEKNMTDKRQYKNEWFQQGDPTTDIPKGKVNPKNMGEEFQKIKEKQQALISYKGVQDFSVSSGGTKLYDDEDDSTETEYISSGDPFSKFKYEDLRKVHKDLTVLAVSEKDFDKMDKYASVEQYKKQRQDVKPMEKAEAERIIQEKEGFAKQQFSQKLHQSTVKSMKNEEKGNQFLAKFLQLKN